ncbi:hypothetical protein C922_02920 [Plasmodium inui San Antonio 1]|uniref:Uncharacterized protein n=1 Tax=Plasmodium inui San Antonio 1 TaxID=1237626 RepID=W7AC03_9APIC|nr:hypothetical protein C922_02920 [Plasmodium inui San Antonio 1]EUD66599.1 hypothetical protein C922_02920 [Plasmodium inui San Antonio 1]
MDASNHGRFKPWTHFPLFVKLTFYKRFRYTFYGDYEEQKLSLYSEESFYFSFYDDIVKSETYLEGIKLLIHDERSEYPNTINAIRRFNIYPEIVLGTVWRMLNLKERFLTPFNFYVHGVLLSQAASVGVLFFFSVYLGRSYISGVIFLMLFFSCYREKFIMRLSAFPLRENFASVYMWCNILLIYTILRERKKKHNAYLVFLFLSSFLFFITWQFSVFVTLTHVVALFGLDLLGFNIQKELHSILVTLSCSYVVSLLATFFPRYLMCTYLPFVLASLIITNVLYRRGGGTANDVRRGGANEVRRGNIHDGRPEAASNRRDGAPSEIDPPWILPLQLPQLRSQLAFMLKKGITSIVIFLLLRLTTVGMEKDDSHVLSLLKVRLHLSSHDFDSMIYSVGSEFNPFTRHMFSMIRETSLFDYFVFFNLILLLYGVNYVSHVWRATRGGSDEQRRAKLSVSGCDEQGGDKLGVCNRLRVSYCDRGVRVRFEVFHAQFLYLVVQFIFFVLLMLIISRLRVLALPLMCLLSSLVGSPLLLGDIYSVTRENLLHLGASKKNLSRLIIQGICLLECAYPFAKYFPTYEYVNLTGNEPVNIEKNLDLVVWLRQNLKEGEPILTDIPTSSFLRSTTNFKMVLNPQYENVAMRRRVQDYYMFSSCLPFSDAKRYYYDRYKVRYFVANIYRCASISNEATNAFSIAELVGSDYARCRHRTSMKFCQRVLYDDRNYKTLYRNGKFSVIYFDPVHVLDDSPYEQFDEGKYAHVRFYIPWISRCMQTDSKCQEHIVDVARSHLDILRYNKIGFTLYKFVQRTFLDGKHSLPFRESDLLSVGSIHPSEEPSPQGHNLHTLFHMAEFYDYDVRDAKKAHQLYKRAIQLITLPRGCNQSDQPDQANQADEADEADRSNGVYRAHHPSVTVPTLVPFVPIAKRIQMITSYIYFLLDTASSAGRADILNLYQNMDLLVVVAGSALDDGFYYEGGTPRMKERPTRGESHNEANAVNTPNAVNADNAPNAANAANPTAAPPTGRPDAGQTIRRTFNAGDLDSAVTLLCENAAYLYKIRKENPKYISIYKKMWTLAKRVSHMNECVLRNYHLFEQRRIGVLDYLAFFYLYR